LGDRLREELSRWSLRLLLMPLRLRHAVASPVEQARSMGRERAAWRKLHKSYIFANVDGKACCAPAQRTSLLALHETGGSRQACPTTYRRATGDGVRW